MYRSCDGHSNEELVKGDTSIAGNRVIGELLTGLAPCFGRPIVEHPA